GGMRGDYPAGEKREGADPNSERPARHDISPGECTRIESQAIEPATSHKNRELHREYSPRLLQMDRHRARPVLTRRVAGGWAISPAVSRADCPALDRIRRRLAVSVHSKSGGEGRLPALLPAERVSQ